MGAVRRVLHRRHGGFRSACFEDSKLHWLGPVVELKSSKATSFTYNFDIFCELLPTDSSTHLHQIDKRVLYQGLSSYKESVAVELYVARSAQSFRKTKLPCRWKSMDNGTVPYPDICIVLPCPACYVTSPVRI